MPRLLLVDDSTDALDLLKMTLERDGYCGVAVAEDGEEALKFLQQEEPLPDLIILDMVMPNLDGWGFLKKKQEDERLRDIPVVLVTGTPANHVRVQEMKDVRLILSKPYEPAKLLRVISSLAIRDTG